MPRLRAKNLDVLRAGRLCIICAKAEEAIAVKNYITSYTRQGIQSFATQSAALFSILRPEYALHVGVCAAISGQNIELEDVIFGEIALNYEEGKWIVLEQKTPMFIPRKVILWHGFLLKRQSGWKHGDFISGCAVRLDAKSILDCVRTTGSTWIALDMEASAFLQVCRYASVKALGIIKGVSEMGDGIERGGKWHIL
ncbi:hypothetical protein DPV78_005758 [Talaromyces pinophilus]|nr:hypothetical protein DPV78_005758 [Talaromyces pinophilus]